jgi:hypothetical protein
VDPELDSYFLSIDKHSGTLCRNSLQNMQQEGVVYLCLSVCLNAGGVGSCGGISHVVLHIPFLYLNF